MQLMLKYLCIRQSSSKSHTPYDNSASEAFFKSLKTEELYRSIYRSEAELKACISIMSVQSDKENQYPIQDPIS